MGQLDNLETARSKEDRRESGSECWIAQLNTRRTNRAKANGFKGSKAGP
jgi:hypothetical protein